MAIKKTKKTGLVNSKGQPMALPRFGTQKPITVSSKTKGLTFAPKSTGLTGTTGLPMAVPKMGVQKPVNISSSIASGGLTMVGGKSTGLVDSKGRPMAVPRMRTGGGISVPSTGVTFANAPATSVQQAGTTSRQSTTGGTSTSSLASGTSSTPTTNVVNTPNLNADAINTPLTLPETTVPDYSKYIPPPIEQVAIDAKTEKDTALQDLLKSMSETPSSEESFARAQRESGVLEQQKIVGDLTGQLNAIVAKGQAQQLAQVGQGRGIPEAIIGGIQAQIGRETAIAALPVQAQLSAAQGNLEMANENLETLFKIYSEDAEREYNNKKEMKKLVYDIASEKEKRALDKLDKQEERAYQETKDLNDERLMYSKMAFANGQSSLGAKIAKLDYKSPTFRQDLFQLQTQLEDRGLALDMKIKEAQLNKLRMETEEIAGSNSLIMPTGSIEAVKSNVATIASNTKIPATAREQARKALSVLNKIQEMVKDNPDGNFAGGRFTSTLLAPLRPASMESKFQKLKADEAKIRQDLVTYITGAAYTSLQADDVNKMIPRSQLYDKQNVDRLTNLTNTIMGDLESVMISSGVNVQLPRYEDLWESEAIGELSPEQEAELQALGLL